jgi:hypothetical protein
VLVTALLGAVPFVMPSPGSAGEQPTKTAPGGKTGKGPEAVEVRFTDNSNIKLMLRDEQVSIVTRYGRLTIPIADIRRIEFATRVSDDIARRIETVVPELGNPQFKLREDASAELRGYREKAYPALLAAVKSSDQEIARRAEELLEWLRATVSPELLELRAQDTVHTEDMKIAGRIEAIVLKAHTFQFGEQSLKLADLRSLRALSVADAADEPKNVMADPGTLHNLHNQLGKTFHFRVTGAVNGSVWGTDVYTSDSSLAAAAVHAGVLQPGQTGIVRVTIVPPPPTYVGSNRQGVASSAYGNYPGAYQVSRPVAPGG